MLSPPNTVTCCALLCRSVSRSPQQLHHDHTCKTVVQCVILSLRTACVPLLCFHTRCVCVSLPFWIYCNLVEKPNLWPKICCLPPGECAQIAERLRKAIGKAAEGKPLQGQAAAVLGQQAASAPGYEGDVEMQ